MSSLPEDRPGYRPDIDGLRAIAVLAVVVFHLNKTWLPGGFTGVDVFFVISGFLITGILSRDIYGGKFSYASFYRARARRILPATLFCVVVTLIVGCILLLPQDVASLGASAAASAVWVANAYFWLSLDTSYFAASSELVPLLHLWSLAVEEQFYLLWPPFLVLMHHWMPKVAKHLLVLILAVASFQLGQSLLVSHPSFAYYVLQTRAGELMLGGLAYWATTCWGTLPRLFRELCGVVGLGLIFMSAWSLDEVNGFPGYSALIPTAGAALALYSASAGTTLVARFLALPPLVQVGRVSFSLYLWHWPVMAFYRYAYGNPSLWGYISCIAAMSIMTLVSYLAVERTFRTGRVRGKLDKAIAYPLSSMAVVLSGVTLMLTGGAPFLFKSSDYVARLAKLDVETKPAIRYPYNCQMGRFQEGTIDDRRCILGDASRQTDVLLWGDSHAAHLVGYFKVMAENYGLSVRNVSMSGCMPIFGVSSRYSVPSIQDDCSRFNSRMESEVSKYPVVVVGSAWVGFDRGSSREDIANTIELLSKRVPHVVIALSVPLFPDYDRRCERKSLSIPGMNCSTDRYQADGLENNVNAFLAGLASKYPNVSVLDLHPLICDGIYCNASSNGRLLYYDAGHLSMLGSQSLGEKAIGQGSAPPFVIEAAAHH